MHIRNQTSLPAPGVAFLHASAHEVAPARRHNSGRDDTEPNLSITYVDSDIVEVALRFV